MQRRDLIKILRAAGYREARNDGGHAIYEKSGGLPAQVPNHREIKESLAKAILKQAGLKSPMPAKH